MGLYMTQFSYTTAAWRFASTVTFTASLLG